MRRLGRRGESSILSILTNFVMYIVRCETHRRPVKAQTYITFISVCEKAWFNLPALEVGNRWFESSHTDQFEFDLDTV